MGRHRKDLSFIERDGTIYARIHRKDGSYVRRSTFISARDENKENKQWEWAAANLETIQNEALLEKDLKFETFAKDFYRGGSSYLQVRKDAGIDYKAASMDANQSYLDNHVLPAFKSKKLSEITIAHVDKWLSTLAHKKGKTGDVLSLSTRKHCLQVLNDVMSEAVRRGIIKDNPALHSVGFKSGVGKRKKEILTQEEFEKLFLEEDSLAKYWDGRLKYYVICFMAALVGSRQSELLGLQKKHIHENHFVIEQNFYRKYGITTTKTETSRRAVPLFVVVKPYLRKLLEENPYGDSPEAFVFYGESPTKPMNYSTIGVVYSEALNRLGIPRDKQKERRLTFHALRNFAITYMESLGIPNTVVRAIVGHKDEEMSNHYMSYNPDFFANMLKTVDGWLDTVKLGAEKTTADSPDESELAINNVGASI
jgi:integrase